MRIAGRVWKDKSHWLAEIPMIDGMTQGRSKKDALAMIAEYVELLVDQRNFKVTVHPGKGDYFELSANDDAQVTALILKRQRIQAGLSLAEVSRRLGQSSRNAYARFEQGKSVPTVTKLNELLRAINPKSDFVIRRSAA